MIAHLYILLALVPFLAPRRYCNFVTCTALVVSAAAVIAAAFGAIVGVAILPYLPALDTVGAIFALLFCVTIPLSAIAAGRDIVTCKRSCLEVKLHFSLIIALFWALIGLLGASSRFEFLAYWEAMSVISFMMLMWRGRGREFLHSAVGYFIAMHVGFFFIFGGFASLGTQSTLWGSGTMSIGSWLLFFVGFGLKSAIFPLHFWLAPTYRGAGSMTASIFGGAVTNIGLYGIFRASYAAADATTIGYILLVLGALSAVVGAVSMISKSTIRGVLSYSSIENIGIVTLGFGLGFYAKANGMSTTSMLAFIGAFVHLFSHGAAKSLLFLSAGKVERICRTSRLTMLGGIAKRMPVNASGFAVGALSLAAAPPFGGFAGEFFIVCALLTALTTVSGSIVGIGGVVVVAFAAGATLFNMAKLFGFGFLGRANAECPNEKISHGIVVSYSIFGSILLIAPWVLAVIMAQNSAAIFGILSLDATATVVQSSIWASGIGFGFIALVAGLTWVKNRLNKNRSVSISKTWSCAAEREPFSKTSSESWLAEAADTFRIESLHHTRQVSNLVRPAHFMRRWTARLAKLQTGRTSHYVMHILLFLALILVLTLTGAI